MFTLFYDELFLYCYCLLCMDHIVIDRKQFGKKSMHRISNSCRDSYKYEECFIPRNVQILSQGIFASQGAKWLAKMQSRMFEVIYKGIKRAV